VRANVSRDVPDALLELPNMASTSALLHHWAVTDHPFVGRRPSTCAAARSLAVVLAIALTVAACGTTNPTRAPATAAPTPTIGTTPTIGMTPTIGTTPTPTPTSVPTRTIVPVPTSQLPAPASSPAAHLDARTAATLQTTLNAIRSKGHFPGMSAAVVFPDGSMWTGQSGVGVLSTGAPVTADTLFAVGSISKTFTGALALRLAERGTISLDDPVSRWVPTFPNAANITLRELLNHTSGIRDLFDPSVYKYIGADRSAKWTPEQVLSLIGKPYFAPGKGYHYSSTNYVLLGVVLERATG
jgi:D-alanyl-D-alanine carboxypeptidase